MTGSEGDDPQPVVETHVLIVGDSGTGKTTLTRKTATETDAVTLTAKDTSFGGRRVAELEAVRNAIDRREDVVVDAGDPDATASMIMKAAKERPIPIATCFPEAHNYLYEPEDEPAERYNPVWWGLTEGRDEGIKVILDQQDPSDLPYTPLKQVPYIAWCGGVAGFQRGFLKHPIGNWIPEDRLADRPLHYVVMHKSGTVVYPDDGGVAKVPAEYAGGV